MPSLVSIAEVRALVATGLSDTDLQVLIDREEANLAGEIGALSGSRVETFTITDRSLEEPVRLARTTGAIAVTEANAALTDVRLAADRRTVLRLIAGGWAPAPWAAVVEVTSTPDDTPKVKTWVIELVRARLGETGFDSESAGDYSYSRGSRSPAAIMAAAKRDILGRPSGIVSVRLTTGYSPTSAWLGSVRP